MISATTKQDWVPTGLVGLIMPPAAITEETFASPTAQSLIARGAELHIMADDHRGVLSFKPPPGKVEAVFSVQHLLREAA